LPLREANGSDGEGRKKRHHGNADEERDQKTKPLSVALHGCFTRKAKQPEPCGRQGRRSDSRSSNLARGFRGRREGRSTPSQLQAKFELSFKSML
jgi:hypothetical protein